MTNNISVLLLGLGTLLFGMALSVASANDSNLADVIKARDSGDVQTLQHMITEARRLHSELLGEAIPYTTMGGARFGPTSTRPLYAAQSCLGGRSAFLVWRPITGASER